MSKEFCCDEFAKQTNELSLAGGGWVYPKEMMPERQIELDDESGNWNVNGCCGGGCYVLQDLKYCPFCGKYIATKSLTNED